MSANPVNAWDARLLAASETAFGTPAVPANVAAYAALAVEYVKAEMGPAEVGNTRAKKDRNLGRGMTAGFVEGRVAPFPWAVELAVKSRSAIDADPREVALYKAAGLKKTVNAGVSCVLSPSATPIESGDFVSATLTRLLGASPATYESEVLRGCLTRTLRWEGGDKELYLKAAGVGIAKGLTGGLDSVTLTIGATSLTCTAEESYRLAGLGYFLCESEVIQVTACAAGGTTATIARGALGTAAAAHTAKAFQPLAPTGITFSGAPLAEATTTASIGGVSARVLNWYFELTTGMDALPGETGSKYTQGAKYGRYDAKLGMRLILSGDQVSLLGKATARPTVAVALSQGVGVGGVWSLSAPYCEVVPFVVPDATNDVAIVDVSFRLRDNAANDMFAITLT